MDWKGITMLDEPTGTAVVPFLGHGGEGADAWTRMQKSDRRRLAMRAAREKDLSTLWSLTKAWLRTFSVAGTTTARKTLANHRLGVRRLREAWAQREKGARCTACLRPPGRSRIHYPRSSPAH